MSKKEEIRKIAAQCNLSDEELEARAEKRFKEERLRPLHDACKEHPFWRTLSNDFHTDCVDKLREVLDKMIGNFSKDDFVKCPHVVLILPVLHNLYDSILKAKIMPKYYKTTVMETKCFGNYILCLQTALQILHYYIDDIFDEDSMVIYEPMFEFDNDKKQYVGCTYNTFAVRSNSDGTYRSVRIISKDEVNDLIEWHSKATEEYSKLVKYFDEHGQKAYAESNAKIVEYHKSCINDLKDNKEKHFVIK